MTDNNQQQSDNEEYELHGVQAPHGVVCNEGVTMYAYGSKTFASRTKYEIPISYADAQNSLIYAYFKPLGASSWYFIPGKYDNQYEVSSLIYQSGASTYMHIILKTSLDANYSTPVTWAEFKIIIVPIP